MCVGGAGEGGLNTKASLHSASPKISMQNIKQVSFMGRHMEERRRGEKVHFWKQQTRPRAGQTLVSVPTEQ